MEKYLDILKENDCIPENDMRLLSEKLKEVLLQEANIVQVQAPITVCGDVHGQFYDVLELFRIGGQLPKTSYIFIGDFVDRGYHSVETIEYLFCLKLMYPDKIFLLRGNHESRGVT